jgi:benzoylformate decarboxylase
MVSVRAAALELFRSHGLTDWFGNPGSSELTFLRDFPSDFRYYLGLQEMIPVGMADGYAQISRHPRSSTCTLRPAPVTLWAPSTTPRGTRRPCSSQPGRPSVTPSSQTCTLSPSPSSTG